MKNLSFIAAAVLLFSAGFLDAQTMDISDTGSLSYDAAVTRIKLQSRGLLPFEKCIMSLAYPAEALNEITLFKGNPVLVESSPIIAQIVNVAIKKGYGITINNDIFFPDNVYPGPNAPDMAWLAHEMRHTRQFKAFRSITQYFKVYAWYVVKAGLKDIEASYIASPFENDANVYENAVSKVLFDDAMRKALRSADNRDLEVCRLVKEKHDEYVKMINTYLAGASEEKAVFDFPGFLKDRPLTFHIKGECTKPVSGRIKVW